MVGTTYHYYLYHYEWRRRPWMRGAIGGKIQRRDVWNGIPQIPDPLME